MRSASLCFPNTEIKYSRHYTQLFVVPFVFVQLCVYVCMCVLERARGSCEHVFATVYVWRSEDNLNYHSPSLPCLRQGPAAIWYCVGQASWPTSFWVLSCIHLANSPYDHWVMIIEMTDEELKSRSSVFCNNAIHWVIFSATKSSFFPLDSRVQTQVFLLSWQAFYWSNCLPRSTSQ